MQILGRIIEYWVRLDEQMRDSIRTGITFGLTSAAITTLGLMVGLNSGTNSRIAVLGGILTIAIADAFSDALGIHISEEAENNHTSQQIWVATTVTFLAKFLFSATFAVPIVVLPLSTAIVTSIIWGLAILVILSFVIARAQGEPPKNIIGEHLVISLVVIAVSQWVGSWVRDLGG
jgi:VIT1/CCC1 family predicted Fe2+/Mn2+ transporter